MGGVGSGRQGGGPLTTDQISLDVRFLQRYYLLTLGHNLGRTFNNDGVEVASIGYVTGIDELTLSIRHSKFGSEWKTVRCHVSLEWTPCNYGGQRAWFRCPADGCGRRVALLYLGNYGRFVCRHCNKLAYRSQRVTDEGRVLGIANKIRKQLAWTPGVARGHGLKPKGMHWRTFERLIARYDVFATEALSRISLQLDLIELEIAVLSRASVFRPR